LTLWTYAIYRGAAKLMTVDELHRALALSLAHEKGDPTALAELNELVDRVYAEAARRERRQKKNKSEAE
jgi:hypothetical protein